MELARLLDRHDTWVNAIGEPKGQQFISNLVASGFNGLWLDRYGYHDADTIQTSLTDRLGQPAFVSSSGRYVFYSLTSQQAEWQKTPEAERREQQSKLMDATTLRYGDGFYDRENADGIVWRWSKSRSSIIISNPSDEVRQVHFRTTLRGAGKMHVQSGDWSGNMQIPQGGYPLDVPLELQPRSRAIIEFNFDGAKVEAEGDPRELYFQVINRRWIKRRQAERGLTGRGK